MVGITYHVTVILHPHIGFLKAIHRRRSKHPLMISNKMLIFLISEAKPFFSRCKNLSSFEVHRAQDGRPLKIKSKKSKFLRFSDSLEGGLPWGLRRLRFPVVNLRPDFKGKSYGGDPGGCFLGSKVEPPEKIYDFYDSLRFLRFLTT